MKIKTLLSVLLGASSASTAHAFSTSRYNDNQVTVELIADPPMVDPTFSTPTSLATPSSESGRSCDLALSSSLDDSSYIQEMSSSVATYTPGFDTQYSAAGSSQYTPGFGDQYGSTAVNQYASEYGSQYPRSYGYADKSRIYRRASIMFEHFADHEFRKADGEFNYTNAYVTVPLRNPRAGSFKGWHFGLSLNTRFTLISEANSTLIDESDLYTASLVASFIYNIDKKAQLTIGAQPLFSSDLDSLSMSSFYFGVFTAISYRANPRLHVMLGISYTPDYYSQDFWPLANVSWEFFPTWNLRIQAHRISTVKIIHSTLRSGSKLNYEFGPFAQWNSYLWNVKRDRQNQLLRMQSFIVGATAQVDILTTKQNRMRFYADVGWNFDQDIRFSDKNNEYTISKYKADPGLYARVGADFTF